ncbi:MAG: ABC transporter substrate-binding protein, partial [Nocardioidaceae bacterium]
MAAVSVLALTALAACGGGDDDGETSTGGPSDSETSFIEGGGSGQGQKADAPVPVPEIEGAVAGGNIDVVSISGLTTMHPSEAYYVNTASILSNLVVRSLTQYIYDAEAKQMVLVPDLATDLGTPNDDFTEWTFTLRDGIKYEDGSPVTAEDMKFGILASFDRDTFPDGAAYSNDYFLNGDKYKGPYSDPQGDCDCVTVSGNDITIKMAAPFPDMPYWGAFPAISPIPEAKAKDPNAYARHPLATGPYKFGDYKPGDTLELVRNDQWD